MWPGVDTLSGKQPLVPSLVPRAWFLQRSNVNGIHDRRSSVDKTRGAVGFSSAKAAALAEILLPAFCPLPLQLALGCRAPPPQGLGSYLACSLKWAHSSCLKLICSCWVEPGLRTGSNPPHTTTPQPGPPTHAILKIGSSDLKDTGLFLRCFKKEERSPLLPLSPLQSFLLYPSVGKSCKGTATELDK